MTFCLNLPLLEDMLQEVLICILIELQDLKNYTGRKIEIMNKNKITLTMFSYLTIAALSLLIILNLYISGVLGGSKG